MQFAAALRDRLVAGDPGLTRFLMALRATSAVGVALAVLLVVARLKHLPLTVPLVGAALGMTWAIAVNDAGPRQQRITTLLLWFPAAAMLTLGTYTAPNRLISDALFVVILFGSVYIRRYGPRGFAIGMVGVLAFFFSLFLRATFAQLPWLLFALAVTAVCTYVLRFFAFPDRPQYAFKSGIAAFRARQRLIRAAVRRGASAREINHHLFRLNETAIALDDLLRDENLSELRAAILDAELETQAKPGEARELRLEAPVLHAGQWTPRGVFRAGTQIDTGRLPPTTRQAIQLTIAAIPAIVAGEMLSAQRWYWAVLTAFVVFSGTTSAGETLRKAWSRVAGTAFGVAAGLLVAIAVRGNEAAALALLFVFLFIAVYGLRLSYGLMTFGITAVLSLLYVLLGLFTDQILLLRLIETAVGAAFGGAAATFVFPIHTESVVNNVIAEALNRLERAVDLAKRRLDGDATADPLPAARAYDESFQTARAQLLPLIYTLRLRPDENLRARLLLLAACAYSLRNLVRLALEDGPTQEVRAHVERIDRSVHRLQAML